MTRKIIPGVHTFVDEPARLDNFTSATNILFEDSDITVNYTNKPLFGISTDKFILAVDRSNEALQYVFYAYEDTSASSIGLQVTKGWWSLDTSTAQVSSISAPDLTVTDQCSINDELTTDQANALFTTPIVETEVEYERVLFKGQEELTMAEFEALTSIDDAVNYNITDFPVLGIDGQIMDFALTCKRLFKEGDTFTCNHSSASYEEGHTYRLTMTSGKVKTWKDITPNGGGGSTSTQYKELPDLPINESNKVIQYIGETSSNQLISLDCVINLGLIPYDRSTTYTMTWDIGGNTYNTTLTKDESIPAWVSSQDQPEDSTVDFILISTANQFNQGTLEGDTDTEKYCVIACHIPKESYTIIKHIKNKGNIHIQDIIGMSDLIFHMGQTQGLDNLAKFDLMRRENEIYSLPRELAQAIKNEYLPQDVLKSFNFASTYQYEYNLLLDTTYKSGNFQITFNKDNTCMIPNGLPDYEISSDCAYTIIPDDHIIEIYENGTFKLNLYVDDTYRSFKFSSPDNFDKVYVFTGGFTKGYFYTNPEISISSGHNWLQWEYLKI